MKARLIDVHVLSHPPINIKTIKVNHFDTPYHFHELCELNYVVSSFGKRIVGDSINNFSAGDLVLMSPNVPHTWYSDPSLLKTKTQSAKAIVIYFSPEVLSKLTEESQIVSKMQSLIENAGRGIRFYGETRRIATERLNAIASKKGLKIIIEFLEILDLLIHSTEYEALATVGYSHSLNEKDQKRINDVFKYLMKNFKEPISLAEISRIANLTPPAFCNFFKKRSGKSFLQFMNELRIGHSCKLLQNQELTIADVCFQSGYQNFSNFNKFFKKITNKTPRQYRNEFA